jgi:hypothetical protein
MGGVCLRDWFQGTFNETDKILVCIRSPEHMEMKVIADDIPPFPA